MKRDHYQERYEPEDLWTTKCENCGVEIDSEIRHCPICGYEIGKAYA